MKSKISQIKKVTLSLGQRSHKIYIGAGAVTKMGEWLKNQPSKRAFIIADKNLKQAREALVATLKHHRWEICEIAVQAGEQLKDFNTIYPLYADLLKGGANRDSVLFALGGGTIGDAAGFLASTYLRGIAWVGVPTTLLAQVDSSVVGKTGINHTEGKNLIGSFYQPVCVICDTQFLKTLGPREIISGFGEMVKYGMIFDPEFFRFLKKNSARILALDPSVLLRAIQKSLHWKAKIVAKDELDRTGLREVLNFGHTFGHALESMTQYAIFQHGEAVIWGMRFALALSVVRKKLTIKKLHEFDAFLSQLNIPPLPADFSLAELLRFMKQDKKVRSGKIHFVLLRDLGNVVSDSNVSQDDLYQAYRILVERVNI